MCLFCSDVGQAGVKKVEYGPHISRLVIPHQVGPKLVHENAAVEHDVDNVSELEVPCGRAPFDLLDHGIHLIWVPPDDALLVEERSNFKKNRTHMQDHGDA